MARSSNSKQAVPTLSVSTPSQKPSPAIPAAASNVNLSVSNVTKSTGTNGFPYLVKTVADNFIDLLVAKKAINISDAARQLNTTPKAIEEIAKAFEAFSLVEVHYPINVFEQGVITLVHPLKESYEPDEIKLHVELEYMIVADVPAIVHVLSTKTEKFYHIIIPKIGVGTQYVIDYVKEDLIKKLPSTTESEVKLQLDSYLKLISDYFGKYNFAPQHHSLLTGYLGYHMFGLGEIEILMHDDFLEEVVINGGNQPLGVYHKKFGWLKSNLYIKREEDIYNYSAQIGRKAGRQIAVLTPIMDARLDSGDRVCSTLYPISSSGNTITIRRFSRDPWTISRLIDPVYNTMSLDMAAIIWLAINYEFNIIVAGGTASGKTSALNAMLSFIPPNQRVLTIEDTRELVLPKHLWNWVPLLTRSANVEGLGEVTMLDLMVTSLRMRPDRIVLGEMRRQHEAEVLFEAMHTGHSVYSTLHADTSVLAIRRLTQAPLSIPVSELESLHLLIVQFRDRRKNVRRTLELSEISMSGKGDEVSPNVIYRWRPRTDEFTKIAEPQRFYEHLNLYTGLTQQEILDELTRRKNVLEWMVKNDVKHIDQVSKLFSTYYTDPEFVYDLVAKGRKPDALEEFQ